MNAKKKADKKCRPFFALLIQTIYWRTIRFTAKLSALLILRK